MRNPIPPTAVLLASALVLATGCAQPTTNYPRPRGVESYVAATEAYEQGNRAAAKASLQQAIDRNPNLIMPRNALGTLYREEGDYQNASQQYEVLTRLDPYYYENHYHLGLCYQLLSRLPESSASYARAVQLNPQDARSASNLGLVYLAMNQPDEAVFQTRRATQLQPDSANAFANYGLALDARGDLPAAESAYLRSLELDANQPMTLINLGSNLLAQNKPEQAIPTLQRAVSASPTPLAHRRLGDAHLAAGQIAEAQAQYEKALALDPTYYPAMNEIGRALVAQYEKGLRLEDRPRQVALAYWRKSLELNPQQPAIRTLLQQWDAPSKPR